MLELRYQKTVHLENWSNVYIITMKFKIEELGPFLPREFQKLGRRSYRKVNYAVTTDTADSL
jgi:hypothetical protein